MADPQRAAARAWRRGRPTSAWARPEGELALAQLVRAPRHRAEIERGLCRPSARRCARRRRPARLMPPAHILNAPTKLMKEIGYGEGYDYDHDAEDGFSGPELLPRRAWRGSASTARPTAARRPRSAERHARNGTPMLARAKRARSGDGADRPRPRCCWSPPAARSGRCCAIAVSVLALELLRRRLSLGHAGGEHPRQRRDRRAGGLGVEGEMRLLLVTGFLGGFTTFSAFSLETGCCGSARRRWPRSMSRPRVGLGLGALPRGLLAVQAVGPARARTARPRPDARGDEDLARMIRRAVRSVPPAAIVGAPSAARPMVITASICRSGCSITTASRSASVDARDARGDRARQLAGGGDADAARHRHRLMAASGVK